MLGITFFHASAKAGFVGAMGAGTSVQKGRGRSKKARRKRRETCRNMMIVIAGFSGFLFC